MGRMTTEKALFNLYNLILPQAIGITRGVSYGKDVRWQVVEFPSGTVQRGTQSLSATGDTDVDITLTSVDTTKTIHNISFYASSLIACDDIIESEITGATTLNLSRAGDGIAHEVEWQVYEGVNWSVQAVNESLAASTSSGSETITSVDTDTAFVFGVNQSTGSLSMGYSSDASTTEQRSMQYRAHLSASTTVNFARSQNGIASDFRTYVIEVNEAASGTTYDVSVSEGMTISDTVTVTVDFDTIIAESAAFSDTITSTMIMEAAVDESMTASDADTAGLELLDSITESATISDLLTALVSFNHSVAEGLIATDTMTALADLIGSVLESMVFSDQVEAQMLFESAISESLSIGDTMTAELIGEIEAAIAEGASMSLM